jgi:hypothetical protein
MIEVLGKAEDDGQLGGKLTAGQLVIRLID